MRKPASAKPKTPSPRQFALEVGKLLANTRCSNVVVLDAAGISPVTDFMVLATGTSPRQMKTAADQIDALGESSDYRPLSRAGDESGQWIVVDFFHVVAHIFSADARSFYDLDNLWGDAKAVRVQADAEGETKA